MSSAYVPLLLSALAFFISVISLFYFRSYLRRRTGQERILSELREEVDNILKSIDETTDRDISLIEEREKNLKSLLAEIEKRLKVYIREAEKQRNAEEAYAALLPKDKTLLVPAGQNSARSNLSYEELGRRRYRGAAETPPTEETPPQIAGKTASEAEAADRAFPLPRFRVKLEEVSGGPAAPPEEVPALSLGEQIRELSRAGFAAPLIASRLGISIAEVEFAAALLERRDDSAVQ